jgi:hypothetical protein
VITTIRSTAFAALLAVVAVAGAACAPTAGPLGTPATPVASTGASEPAPSDVVPESPSPTAAPSEPASVPPTEVPSGSTAPATTAPATTTPTLAPPTAAPVGTMTVRAYFMLGSFTDNPGLAPVLRAVPETKAVARAAMTALLAGPQGAELEASPAMYTAIPDGTKLVDISIADKVATVTLSREWNQTRTNFNTAQPTAQVVYTLTQFSSVKTVLIGVEGSKSLEGPWGRSDFQELGILPAIFVDHPAWGAAAGNPVTISGIANVFEATFRVQVLNAKGGILADEQVMATCGTGCWGTFKQDVAYSVAKAQYGTLRVFDLSAKDGVLENLTEYRVWLTP